MIHIFTNQQHFYLMIMINYTYIHNIIIVLNSIMHRFVVAPFGLFLILNTQLFAITEILYFIFPVLIIKEINKQNYLLYLSEMYLDTTLHVSVCESTFLRLMMMASI